MTDFNNMKCLVTGGAGFIGSSLVETLVSFGARVKVVDNLSVGDDNLSLLRDLEVDFHNIDISDIKQLSKVFKDIDVVFHLAAMNRAQRSIEDPIKSNNVNINGTLNCLHLSSQNNVKKFIFISSSSVYKGVKDNSLTEDMRLEPLHPYGVGKLAGEHYCRLYNDLFGLDTLVLRYFSVYGPRQKGNIRYAGVIPKFFYQALNNQDITIFGDGNQKRNFSFVSDVVRGTLKAAENSDMVGSIVNIAAEDETTVLDIAQKILQITNSKSKIVFLPPIKGDPSENKADISKLKKLLNFSPSFDIKSGLISTYEAIK